MLAVLGGGTPMARFVTGPAAGDGLGIVILRAWSRRSMLAGDSCGVGDAGEEGTPAAKWLAAGDVDCGGAASDADVMSRFVVGARIGVFGTVAIPSVAEAGWSTAGSP